MTKLNPWLEKKIPEAERRGSPLRYIIEVAPNTREAVKAQLKPLPKLSIISQPADRFITIEAPPEILTRVEAIPEVVKVSAETLVWVKSPIPFLGIPTPLETFKLPTKFDPYLGQVKLSAIEIPVSPAQALAMAPIRALALNDIIVFTTEKQRQYIGAPKDNKIKIKCAVADTGLGIVPLLLHPNTKIEVDSKVPGELPWDGQGHGTWCTACAFGDEGKHPRWGNCNGVADPDTVVHIKCLSNLGFGMTSWILDSIFEAWKRECKVLSMSLGGPLQGSAIDDDPLCRLISILKDEVLCVVAAGNEGPSEWTIGSPGASPDCLTVGAWSMTDDDVSYFSSRGPSGEFYRDNPDIWAKDVAIRGDDMIKPDICAPGGGRRKSADKDEQILSGCSGWYDPYGDPLPGFAVMKGTSMATPAAAGLTAIAYDRGLIRDASDVKRLMSHYQAKNFTEGYGLLIWDKLLE